MIFLHAAQNSAVAAGKPAAAAGGTMGRRKSIKKKVSCQLLALSCDCSVCGVV